MSFTRISLYPHELKTIAELTVELTRIDIRDEEGKRPVSDVGPEIFGKLVNILYGPIPSIVTRPINVDMPIGSWTETTR